MEGIFVDTSALIALLDEEAPRYLAVSQAWSQIRSAEAPLITTNYVVTEASAVCQRRLGMDATRDLLTAIAPLLSVVWVDEATHQLAITALLAANQRGLSLVDCVSFDVMRRLGITRAFALDQHFADQGFDCLP